MNEFNFKILETDFDLLFEHLIHDDRNERAAYLLCSSANISNDPWDNNNVKNYLVKEVIPVLEKDVISSSSSHISWSTNSFVSILKKAKLKNLVVAIAHNHGKEFKNFSEQDNDNESDLLKLAINRNGNDTELISFIITPDKDIIGRVWIRDHSPINISKINIIGKSFLFKYDKIKSLSLDESKIFDRQLLAFGKGLIENLKKLKIGIIGCGGTGSAVAMLLTRLGVGNLLLVDNDAVEFSNINRLYGASIEDAKNHVSKVDVIHKTIKSIGIDTNVVFINDLVMHDSCHDALKSCDIIFGCSDDNQGRLFLNRFSYYYLTPIIDMGLAIEVSKLNPNKLQALDGRVTVVMPGNPCLICRNIIDFQIAASEALKRANPAEFERQKAESYVIGEGDPNPAVVTFTTEVATMAVNEMLQRLQNFRGDNGACDHKVRLFHRNHDLKPGCNKDRECAICCDVNLWGDGDVEPFLGRVS